MVGACFLLLKLRPVSSPQWGPVKAPHGSEKPSQRELYVFLYDTGLVFVSYRGGASAM